MIYEISDFKNLNYDINSRLEAEMKNLALPKPNIVLDDKQTKELSLSLKKSQNNRDEKNKANEDDEKKYKLLKRYGDILHLIENLIGIIPASLSNLSTTELETKLKELLTSKKQNEVQFIFIFYQNLYTNSLQNLLTIEKDYQAGSLSQKEALSKVKIVKEDIIYNSLHTPKVLSAVEEEMLYLVTLYENSFSNEFLEKQNNNSHELIKTNLEDVHCLIFEKLNSKTNELITRVGNLSESLTNFQPQVDLKAVFDGLKETDSILDEEVWEVEDLSSSIDKLETTTRSLIDEQTAKNNESMAISDEIKDVTSLADDISRISVTEITKQTFQNARNRAQNLNASTKELEESLNEDSSSTITNIASQYSNVILALMEADEIFCMKVSSMKNASVTFREIYETLQAKEDALALQGQVLSIQEKQKIILEIVNKDTEDDEDSTK